MNKPIIWMTVIIIFLGILFATISFAVFRPTQPYMGVNKTKIPSPQGNSTNPAPQNTISLVELAQHNTEPDCWVGYEGKAYDLTLWLPRHPGSAGAITPYCGTSAEFQQAFAKQHGTRMASLFMRVAIYQGDLAQ